MTERRDDTTKPETESPRERGSYYYDDATGYEIYKPEEDEDACGEKEQGDAKTNVEDERGRT